MSRIQKKKTLSEKKRQKREISSVDTLDEGQGTVRASVSQKTQIEKKQGDIIDVEPNFFQRAMAFFREVKVELKKVTWPTRKQTTGTTVVVIVFVFVVAAFLGLFDYSLSQLVQVILT